MLCEHPWMKNPQDGKWIKFSKYMTSEERLGITPFPCGNCLPCRINTRRIWTHRIMLESRCHSDNIFVTLTYSDQNCPDQLFKSELQDFMKRLRRRIEPQKIRFFGVGEYGDKSFRPHFHLIIFGLSMYDKHYIDESWTKGFIMVGDVTSNSAQYTAGYTMKKMTNPKDPRLNGFNPEFMLSSRRNPGGIGLPAIIRIAKKINARPELANKIIKELYYGKMSLPLGRYLTQKLNALIGTNSDLLDREFWNYQQSLFDSVSTDDHYYWSFPDSKKQERLSQKKRLNIKKRSKIL